MIVCDSNIKVVSSFDELSFILMQIVLWTQVRSKPFEPAVMHCTAEVCQSMRVWQFCPSEVSC